MENKALLSTPGLTRLEEAHEAKKLFSPFSPGGNEYRENQRFNLYTSLSHLIC